MIEPVCIGLISSPFKTISVKRAYIMKVNFEVKGIYKESSFRLGTCLNLSTNIFLKPNMVFFNQNTEDSLRLFLACFEILVEVMHV